VTELSIAQKVVEMAEIVAGGEETLRQRPFAACYINIANPLRHNPESIKKLIWLSRKGLRFVYRPALVTMQPIWQKQFFMLLKVTLIFVPCVIPID